MADSLYLNLWFPKFREAEMLPRVLCLLHHFPFSESRSGVGFVGVHGVSWSEPLLFQHTFDFRAQPEQAVQLASEFLHSDNAYVFEVMWDLWTPGQTYDSWFKQPHPVMFIVHGADFEEGTSGENGHIQVDLGLDTPFLYGDMELTEIGEQRIKENIQKLVTFTADVEKHCYVSSRLLWSESEENLAQKLINRLQKVN